MSARRSWPTSAWGALIFAVTLAAYWPALHGAILWDDPGHITRADLLSLGGLFRIWFEPGATQQYYPLLHSAFWLEHHLWGDATLGYHLINVLLHATSACLFAALLRRLLDSAHVAEGDEQRRHVETSWLAALLFALHPVCVESVAWISEQKNTLSTVFALAAALAYLRFAASDAARARPRSLRWYFLASALFLAALLTKTVTATLPAALLVILWWRNGSAASASATGSRSLVSGLWSLVRSEAAWLLPWFVVGAALGLYTAHFEHTLIGASGADFALGPIERGLLAGRIVWFYLAKLIWPAELIFIYPHWTVDVTATWQWLFPLATIGLAAALWFRKQRGLLAAYLVFVASLFPVLGFVNVFPFVFSFVADHFQYLACLAVIAPAAVLLARLPRFVPVATLTILAALTWRQSAMYRDVFSLYETTLAKNPACWMAHNNLAMALADAGRIDEAIPHLEQALKLRPNFPEAENNFGYDLMVIGRPQEGIPHLERALKLQPRYAEAHNNFGSALGALGRTDEAIVHFHAALAINPNLSRAHFNLGLALARSGRTAEAIPQFVEAVRLEPDYAEAELNWGIGLALTNRVNDAIPHIERALELNPAYADAHFSYARVLASLGRYDAAIAQFEQTLQLNPAHAEAHLQLALLLRQTGHNDEAAAHFAEAQRLRGGNLSGRN